jgi:hypothetical protein
MKKIKAEKYRKGSEIFLSDSLNASIINDNLSTSCTLYWQVLDKDGSMLDQGNLSLDGEEYEAWDNSNEYLFSYIAEKLNIILIEDETDS